MGRVRAGKHPLNLDHFVFEILCGWYRQYGGWHFSTFACFYFDLYSILLSAISDMFILTRRDLTRGPVFKVSLSVFKSLTHIQLFMVVYDYYSTALRKPDIVDRVFCESRSILDTPLCSLSRTLRYTHRDETRPFATDRDHSRANAGYCFVLRTPRSNRGAWWSIFPTKWLEFL